MFDSSETNRPSSSFTGELTSSSMFGDFRRQENHPNHRARVFLHQRLFSSSALSNKAVSFVVISHPCLSDTFWCNLPCRTAMRHAVLLFANNDGWTIPRTGNKCAPRVGSVFLDLSPNMKPVCHSECPSCEHSARTPTAHVPNGDLVRDVVQPLSTPAMPILHVVSRPENVQGKFVSSTDDPLGRRESRRVDAGVLCSIHHGDESSRLHEFSCSNVFDCFSDCRSPFSVVAFNKSVLPRSFRCREISDGCHGLP